MFNDGVGSAQAPITDADPAAARRHSAEATPVESLWEAGGIRAQQLGPSDRAVLAIPRIVTDGLKGLTRLLQGVELTDGDTAP